jgi:iron-sulfur cluster assembly accessory protein
MQNTPTHSISIDDLAVSHVQEVQAGDPALAGKAIRLSVQEVGCEGMSYVFSYDDVAAADVTATYKGVTVAVDPEAIEYVNGCIVTFGELNNEEPSLKVANPNATSSCVCGQSFNVEDGPEKPAAVDATPAAAPSN